MKGRWRLLALNLVLIVAVAVLSIYVWQLSVNQSRLEESLSSRLDVLLMRTEELARVSDVQNLAGRLEQEIDRLVNKMNALDSAIEERIASQSVNLTEQVNIATSRIEAINEQLEAANVALKDQITEQGAELLTEIEKTGVRLEVIRTRLEEANEDLVRQLSQTVGSINDKNSVLDESIQSISQTIDLLQASTDTLSDRVSKSVIDTASLYDNVKDSVVKISVKTPDGDGQGSGFLYGEGGRYVVTAHHVVDGASQINIQALSGEIIGATVVAVDRNRDIALLSPLGNIGAQPLAIGDSDQVKVGDPVVLVGSPFDLEGTVTLGIVSAVGRSKSHGIYTWDSLIQFDASANSGNSGGPLLNGKGEVVGIVSLGIIPTLGSGISWAVPSNIMLETIAPFGK